MHEDNSFNLSSAQVSIYSSLKSKIKEQDITLQEILKAIRTGKLLGRNIAQEITAIRAEPNKTAQSRLKELLPCFTTSGTFAGQKRNADLLYHSGLIQVDFDLHNPTQAAEVKERLKTDPYTLAAYISPSGTGVKAIVRISDDGSRHAASFEAVKDYYFDAGFPPIDTACKNVGRANFISYDKGIFYNAAAAVLLPRNGSKISENFVSVTEFEGEKGTENNTKYNTKPARNNAARQDRSFSGAPLQLDEIKAAVYEIEEGRIDITAGYSNWWKVALSLANFGEEGRSLYHAISRQNSGYQAAETEAKFTEALTRGDGSVKPASFFSICKDFGVIVRKPRAAPTPRDLPQPEGAIMATPQERQAAQPGIAIPDVPPSTARKPANKPKEAWEQVEQYLEESYDLRYNIVGNEVERRPKGEGDFTQCNEADIYRELRRQGIKFSQSDLKAMLASDYVQRYDPIEFYFKSLPAPPDHHDEIKRLCTYIGSKAPDAFEKHFRKMLVRVIACALEARTVNKQAFILIGEKQNTGKSSFLRWLTPPQLCRYYTEEIGADKDGQIALSGSLFINLDELSTRRNYELNQLKALFSKEAVNIRHPYEAKPKHSPRRASFVGSTNEREILNDPTGSVRWLCFEIESINWKYREEVNIDAVWSEAYRLYKNHFDGQLTESEIRENEVVNRDYVQQTPAMDLVAQYCKPGDYFLNTTQILTKLVQLVPACQHLLSTRAVGQALKMYGIAQEHKREARDKADRVKGYYLSHF